MENVNRKNSFQFSFLTFYKILTTVAVVLIMTACSKDQADTTTPWYPETNEYGDSIWGVFESRVPCGDCERLKFGLAIYENAQTKLPSTYIMSRIYVGKSDDRVSNNGNVIITSGTSLDSLHIVYRLTSGAPEEYQFFWKINEDLLFILDEHLNPKVGDAGYGYALNRVR